MLVDSRAVIRVIGKSADFELIHLDIQWCIEPAGGLFQS